MVTKKIIIRRVFIEPLKNSNLVMVYTKDKGVPKLIGWVLNTPKNVKKMETLFINMELTRAVKTIRKYHKNESKI